MIEPAAQSLLMLDIERDGEVAIVRCRGVLVSQAEELIYQSFYDEVSRVMNEAKRVVLDLTDLDQISDVGLSRLIELLRHARTVGCEFELFNPGEQPREFLLLANLIKIFTVRGQDGEILG